MTEATYDAFAGATGDRIAVTTWDREEPSWAAILVHGYGEHLGRYQHVADRLVADGAVVTGPDHLGHGRSEGERVLVDDFEPMVSDVHSVVQNVSARHPGLPIALIGHSMGGMLAARYVQRWGASIDVLVLSGPVLGSWQPTQMLDLLEIPDDPLDVSTLSRDPKVGEVYAADELVWHGPFKRATLRSLLVELETIRAGAGLGSIPTLWVHGADDQLVPIDATRAGIEAIKGSVWREHVFEGARHEVFNETNADEVLTEVIAFCLEHLRTAGAAGDGSLTDTDTDTDTQPDTDADTHTDPHTHTDAETATEPATAR